MDEETYKRELAEAGVDVSDLKEPETPAEPEPTEPEVEEETPTPEEPTNLIETPKEERKRSIYDEYKEKKTELKSEKEAREQAEKERDDWRTKFEALDTAKTPEEKQDAQDEIAAFAEKINADPEALREMRKLFLKDMPSGLTDEDRKALARVHEIEERNKEIVEKQRFEEEFQSVTPTLKEFYPSASAEELRSIKAELDTLSHTKEWHDKSLDYVVFKNKEVLSALVSPKKRGMEGKGRKDVEEESTDFDPNADYSRMSPTQRDAWEEGYRKMTKEAEGLAENAHGKKILL